MTEPEPLELVVDDPEDVGQRADVILGRRLPGISRRVARRLGLEGRLLIDGRRGPPSIRVRAGQRLALRITPPGAPAPATVLTQSERFVYVLKPPGVHTHRLRPDDAPTLAESVALTYPECRHASPDPRQGGAVHRLDRGTTGVVAFARSLEAWRAAREAFRGRRVLKLYRARARSHADDQAWPPAHAGTPTTERPPQGSWPEPEGAGLVIAAPLAPAGRRRVAVRETGREAITVAWPLPGPARPDQSQDLLLRLLTGHRHQARAHLAWLGWPIIGDTTYGPHDDGTLMLHATVLDLSEGCPGEPCVHAPVPDRWLV